MKFLKTRDVFLILLIKNTKEKNIQLNLTLLDIRY